MRRYIITGSPGAGKTTILAALRDRRYAVVDEAATRVNVELRALGRHEPWRDQSSSTRSRFSNEHAWSSRDRRQPLSRSSTGHRSARSRWRVTLACR